MLCGWFPAPPDRNGCSLARWDPAGDSTQIESIRLAALLRPQYARAPPRIAIEHVRPPGASGRPRAVPARTSRRRWRRESARHARGRRGAVGRVGLSAGNHVAVADLSVHRVALSFEMGLEWREEVSLAARGSGHRHHHSAETASGSARACYGAARSPRTTEAS